MHSQKELKPPINLKSMEDGVLRCHNFIKLDGVSSECDKLNFDENILSCLLFNNSEYFLHIMYITFVLIVIILTKTN